jgi:exportin-2 (importin alpha re-exporter)
VHSQFPHPQPPLSPPPLPQVFATAVWELLKASGTTARQPKYDHLVTTSLRFLTSLVQKKMHFELFNNPALLRQVLESHQSSEASRLVYITHLMHTHPRTHSYVPTHTQIVEAIVVPNVTMREDDEELFEDNPTEYIQRDMEVRAPAACSLA